MGLVRLARTPLFIAASVTASLIGAATFTDARSDEEARTQRGGRDAAVVQARSVHVGALWDGGAPAAVDERSGARTVDKRGVARESFVVEPFANTKGTRALDHIRFGGPAFIAERLGRHLPLRFVGPPDLFSGAAAGHKWVVTGSFERLADWRLAVTVEIKDSTGEIAASVRKEGAKDNAATLALDAAYAAFDAIPTVSLGQAPTAVSVPFGRDPYAFVLYGRALASYHGKGGPALRAERGLKLLKRSLLVDPKAPEARRFAGHLHLQEGNPGHARGMWSHALDLRPDYVAALSALAALDRAAGLPSARDRHARLLELDPDDLEARRTYGEILSEAGQLTAAQAELEKVLQVAPHDLRARRSLALVLAARRAGKELAAELETLVRLDPENLEARMDLGAAYMSIGSSDEAAATYEEILRRRPRHSGALKLAADLARERGDLKKASAYYAKLRVLSPQDPRPAFLMAAAHYEAGNLDLAERFFNDAAHYPGMLGDAYSNLGAIAMRRGDVKQALWYLSRASKKRPQKAGIRFNHALALHKLGRSADALNELKAAEGADPNDAGVRFLAGVVCLRLGLLRDAAGYFAAALRLDPANQEARHNLALLEAVVSPRAEGSLSLIDPDDRPAPPPAERAPDSKPRDARP